MQGAVSVTMAEDCTACVGRWGRRKHLIFLRGDEERLHDPGSFRGCLSPTNCSALVLGNENVWIK